MKKAALSFLAIAIFSGMVFSQVNICGKVTDENGKPLTKTLVRLGQTRYDNTYGMAPYYTTTDKDGNYKLGTGNCVVPVYQQDKIIRSDAFSKPAYIGGQVLFSLPQNNLQVVMGMYDLNGRFVREVMNKSLARGNYGVSVDTRAVSHQFYLLRVTINGASSVFLIQPLSPRSTGAVVQNSPEFQTRLEKLVAVVDTLHATEPGYTLGIQPIEALSGQYDFQLKKNHTFDGDTAGFWDTAHAVKQPGKIIYTMLNKTNGKWPDSMIYWAIGDGGDPICLKDQHTVDFTNNPSGRLYIMIGYKPPSGPGTNKRPDNQVWDFEEHTNGIGGDGTPWYHGNTTRVDGYGFPMTYRIHSSKGFDTTRGDLLQRFFQSRESFFAEFINEVPYEFTKLGTMRAPYKIPNPGTQGSDVGPGGKWASYSDKYCNAFGVGQHAYLDGIDLPCMSAGAHRHVLMKNMGTLCNDKDTPIKPEQFTNDKYYYQEAPCNFYSYFLHRRSIDRKCYGFPYDDYANGSSYIEHGSVTWIELAIGW